MNGSAEQSWLSTNQQSQQLFFLEQTIIHVLRKSQHSKILYSATELQTPEAHWHVIWGFSLVQPVELHQHFLWDYSIMHCMRRSRLMHPWLCSMKRSTFKTSGSSTQFNTICKLLTTLIKQVGTLEHCSTIVCTYTSSWHWTQQSNQHSQKLVELELFSFLLPREISRTCQ